jgi:hypothetical protein
MALPKDVDFRPLITAWWRRGVATLATRRHGCLVLPGNVTAAELRQKLRQKSKVKPLPYKRAAELVAEADGGPADQAEKGAMFVEIYVEEHGEQIPPWLSELKSISVNHLRFATPLLPAKRKRLLERANRDRRGADWVASEVKRALGPKRQVGPTGRLGGREIRAPEAMADLVAATERANQRYAKRLGPYATAWQKTELEDRALRPQIAELQRQLESITEAACSLEVRLARLIHAQSRLEKLLDALRKP